MALSLPLKASLLAPADAIFTCLGPALEVFSRYSRVGKASGEPVTLNEYLGQVWAAIPKEALTMILAGADATGFEEDARRTTMWLLTLMPGDANRGDGETTAEDSGERHHGLLASRNGSGTQGPVPHTQLAQKLAQPSSKLVAHVRGGGYILPAARTPELRDLALQAPLSRTARRPSEIAQSQKGSRSGCSPKKGGSTGRRAPHRILSLPSQSTN